MAHVDVVAVVVIVVFFFYPGIESSNKHSLKSYYFLYLDIRCIHPYQSNYLSIHNIKYKRQCLTLNPFKVHNIQYIYTNYMQQYKLLLTSFHKLSCNSLLFLKIHSLLVYHRFLKFLWRLDE